jgi:hypothetical protein
MRLEEILEGSAVCPRENYKKAEYFFGWGCGSEGR